jgi:threonylcarbamoyladenosine tRNA methylthiotransferase MtaB
MSLKVVTLGCRINTYESEVIKQMPSDIDAIVVNTCAVTGEAERQCRQTIRKLRRENPDAFIIVTGCAAQIAPEKYAAMPEVDRVLGNLEKLSAVNFKKAAPAYNVGPLSTLSEEPFSSALIGGFEGRNRAFLQIQQGCDNACTFCIVTKARGKNRSCPPSRVLAEAEKLIKAGFTEFTLTGVNIADYGKDKPEYGNLTSLAALLLSSFPAIARLRFSSLDIAALDDDFVALMASEKRLMPHLHFSLQSGDDLILKRMGRRHSRADTLALCRKLKAARPDIIFGADFIAGFPTETETMFANTLTLVEEVPILLTHVFPFSEREGTPAAKMPPVRPEIRKERAKRLRDLNSRMLTAYFKSLKGSTETVLLESENRGISEHYIHVNLLTPHKAGEMVRVKIVGHKGKELLGEVID